MTGEPKTLKEMKEDLAEYARDDYHDGCYDTIEKIQKMLVERVKEDFEDLYHQLCRKFGKALVWSWSNDEVADNCEDLIKEELLRIAGKEKTGNENNKM